MKHYKRLTREQRYTIERLSRQYFPKGSDFSKLTPKDVQRVQSLLNSRPRKCLAYQTPNDIFLPPNPLALAT
jgi:IS30 family transposase